MAEGSKRDTMLGGDMGMVDSTSIYDYDGREYKIDASLVGTDFVLGGKFEEYNAELLTALREGLIKANGSLTEKGQKELARRRLEKTDYEKEKLKAAEERRAAKAKSGRDKGPDTKDLKDKKPILEKALEDSGYYGSWKLKKEGKTSGSYSISFQDTKGQIDEDKVITADSFEALLEFIRTQVPKMLQ